MVSFVDRYGIDSQLNRILTVTALPGTFRGGIEEYAYSVLSELMSLGFEMYLITSKGKNSHYWTSDEVHYSLKTLYVDSHMLFQRPLPTLGNALTFIKIISLILNCDVVHIHMPYPVVESYVSIITKITRKKLVVTYHMDAKLDVDENEKSKLLKKVFNTILEKACYFLSSVYPLNLADVICTNTMAYAMTSPIVGKYVKKIIGVHQGIKENLRHSIDDNKANEIRKQYLESGYTNLVLFVGRLVRYKGLDYLLDAIKIINAKSDLKIHFVIGGIGPEKLGLVQKCSLYNLHNVSFIGFVKDSELFNLYKASDLVVAPSVSSLESTPISLLCSLMAGTPVVGTSVGGTEETIPSSQYAIIVPPKDAQLLALAISKLLRSSNRKLPKDKVPLISERYWKHVAQDYSSIFLQLQLNRSKSSELKQNMAH